MYTKLRNGVIRGGKARETESTTRFDLCVNAHREERREENEEEKRENTMKIERKKMFESNENRTETENYIRISLVVPHLLFTRVENFYLYFFLSVLRLSYS